MGAELPQRTLCNHPQGTAHARPSAVSPKACQSWAPKQRVILVCLFQALYEALKKWQENSTDPSGKRKKRKEPNERAFIEFKFEQGEFSLRFCPRFF